MRYSQCKDLDRTIREYIKAGWGITRGGKHWIAIAPNGRKLAVPTGGNFRAVENWKLQARRLMVDNHPHRA